MDDIKGMARVIWDEIDPEQYAKVGSFNVSGKYHIAQVQKADVNNEGKVDIADSTLVANKVLGKRRRSKGNHKGWTLLFCI